MDQKCGVVSFASSFVSVCERLRTQTNRPNFVCESVFPYKGTPRNRNGRLDDEINRRKGRMDKKIILGKEMKRERTSCVRVIAWSVFTDG